MPIDRTLPDRIYAKKGILGELYLVETHLRRMLTIDWIEVHQFKVTSVASLYEPALKIIVDEIQKIEKDIADLEKRLPCFSLLRAYGEEFYNFYEAKYPINRDTKIQDWFDPIPTIRYTLPNVEKVNWLEPMNVSPRIEYKIGEARFEAFQHPYIQGLIRLAYAPEINTVFRYVQRERVKEEHGETTDTH